MAAKVLLGVVALTAIVGSPFAYNHFKSSSGETQKEGEKAADKQISAEKPVEEASKLDGDRQEVSKQAPEQSDVAQNPENDKCNLGLDATWDSTEGPLTDKSRCVREIIQQAREQH